MLSKKPRPPMSTSEIAAYLWGARITAEGAGDVARTADIIPREIERAELDVLEAALTLGSERFAYWSLRGASDWVREHLSEQ